jgi:Glycosyl transferase family 2
MNVSLVTETFNFLEGSSVEELRTVLRTAIALCDSGEVTEIILADASGDPAIAWLLAAEFPSVRRLDATGQGYDQAKMLAATEAKGEIVAYLDGDCMPQAGWLEKLTEPLRHGRASASGGFTVYPRGFFSSILSVMDFGFLLPRSSRALGCYAFNNAAFLRQVLLQVPVPECELRCACYLHAQKFTRLRTPIVLAPDARVRHELPPTLRERLRRGYDTVAVCWADGELRESKWLRRGILAAPRFYADAIKLDWRRLRTGYQDLDLARWQMWLGLPLFPILRLIDLIGITGALLFGPKSRKWLDWSSSRYGKLMAIACWLVIMA